MSNCKSCDEVGGPLVDCGVCDMKKKPVGRSAGLYASMGYCDSDCPGYYEEPVPQGLWPGERLGDSMGHRDWHEERQ